MEIPEFCVELCEQPGTKHLHFLVFAYNLHCELLMRYEYFHILRRKQTREGPAA